MISYKNLNKTLLNLSSKEPIYICGHMRPDQDSVGSCIALAEFLNINGKNAKVLLNKKDYDVIAWLNDTSLLTDNIPEKDYVFIALDTNEKKRLGEFEKLFDNAKYTINIDHHQNNLNEACCTFSKPGASSTCELIYNILTANGKTKLNNTIYSCLYSGMMADTNCFTRRLGNKTLCIAQKLINNGADYINIIKKAFSSRSMYEFKALAKLVNELQFDGFHYAVVDKTKEEFCKLTHNQLVKAIAEDLRKIDGIDVFLLIMKDTETIGAKVMSNISENADKIAEMFGGGGHKKEAGFTTKDITVEYIINKTKEFLNLK